MRKSECLDGDNCISSRVFRNKKGTAAVLGFILIIIGVWIFLSSGGFNEPSALDENYINAEMKKNAALFAGPCDFYDSKYDAYIGKVVKFNQATVISNGGTYITFHGGNPQKYGYLELDTNALTINTDDIKPGSQFNIYGIYDGMKTHPNDGINTAVPTFTSGILENIA